MKTQNILISCLFAIIIGSGTIKGIDLAHELQNFNNKLTILVNLLVTETQKQEPPHKPVVTVTVEDPDFTKWKSECDKLPKYEKPPKTSTNKTALTPELFTKAIEAYFTIMKQRLLNAKDWLDSTMPDAKPWNEDPSLEGEIPFVPFVEKITFKTNDLVAFHGDFHGDVHACNNFIQTWVTAGYMNTNFKIINDDFYIIFLGDYTDRGWYGTEVIYTLLRLKIANPTKIFMARGNHEDVNIIAQYGFLGELYRKFENEQAKILLNKITRFYNFLPMAVYFSCLSTTGNDAVQCCHGGIEIGFDPKKFLQSLAQFAYVPKFMQEDGFEELSRILKPAEKRRVQITFNNNIDPDTYNGFMWSDFIVDPNSLNIIVESQRGAGFEYTKSVTQKLLHTVWSSDTHTLRAVFRAHQHTASDNDPMKQVILNYNKIAPEHPNVLENLSLEAPWYKAPEEDAGIAFLWSESETKEPGSLKNILALTFSVAPGTPYDWPYDAFGLLRLAKGYDNWRMQVYRVKRSEYEKE